MFEKYKGTIDLFKVIYDEYHYQAVSLEDLYSKPFIELEVYGVDALCWITFQGEKYLFKEVKDYEYNIWGELISEEFAKLFGFPCASYRFAAFGDRYGVITKSFLKKGESLRLGSEIFQRFINRYVLKNKEIHNILDDQQFLSLYQIPPSFLKLDSYDQKRYIFNHLNNLDQIWSIIENNKKIHADESQNIISSLLNLLIFDIVTLQLDRHPNNWGYIKSDQRYLPNILFDNQKSFGLGYINMSDKVLDFKNELMSSRFTQNLEVLNHYLYDTGLNLTLSVDNIIDSSLRKKDNALKVLQDLLEKSDEETCKKIISTINKIPKNFLENIICMLEEKNGITMNNNLYFYITNLFSLHFSNIQNITHLYLERSTQNEKRI